MGALLYTSAQAAAITGRSRRAIRRAIISKVIKPGGLKSGKIHRWLLSKEHLVYLALEGRGIQQLPRELRRKVAQAIEVEPGITRFPVAGDALAVNVEPARQQVEDELARLARAEQLVHSDPEILHGAPVFRGTRVPVHLIADMLEQGADPEEILEGYSSLNREEIALAPIYAKAFPRRERRPVKRPWSGLKPIRSITVPLKGEEPR